MTEAQKRSFELRHRPIKRCIKDENRAIEIAKTIPILDLYFDSAERILYFGDNRDDSVVVYMVDEPSESLLGEIVRISDNSEELEEDADEMVAKGM